MPAAHPTEPPVGVLGFRPPRRSHIALFRVTQPRIPPRPGLVKGRGRRSLRSAAHLVHHAGTESTEKPQKSALAPCSLYLSGMSGAGAIRGETSAPQTRHPWKGILKRRTGERRSPQVAVRSHVQRPQEGASHGQPPNPTCSAPRRVRHTVDPSPQSATDQRRSSTRPMGRCYSALPSHQPETGVPHCPSTHSVLLC